MPVPRGGAAPQAARSQISRHGWHGVARPSARQPGGRQRRLGPHAGRQGAGRRRSKDAAAAGNAVGYAASLPRHADKACLERGRPLTEHLCERGR